MYNFNDYSNFSTFVSKYSTYKFWRASIETFVIEHRGLSPRVVFAVGAIALVVPVVPVPPEEPFLRRFIRVY